MTGAISAPILLFFGVGVLVVAWRGYKAGELPAGSAGWKAYRPNRTDNPIAFRFFFMLYCAAGLALIVWGVLTLFGAAPALKLS